MNGQRQSPFAAVDVGIDRRTDGAILLHNRMPLGEVPATLIDRLRHWAVQAPECVVLAERDARGGWQRLTYGELWRRTAVIGAKLLAAGCSVERPVMILAPNGIAHAEVALAAMRVGVAAAPVSMTYAQASTDFARLLHAVELLTPALLFVQDGAALAPAIAAVRDRVRVVVEPGDWPSLPDAAAEDLARAESTVGADTVAKLLLTSGSTDKPKAVPTTHRMMCSNQAALARIWPCVTRESPVLVDWLPWNHTFGGSFTFNLALMNGGTFHVDAGKPTPPLIGRTVANLREIAPTAYFNVPAGYEALIPQLAADPRLNANFFSRLAFVFTAAAALPQKARDQLLELSLAASGRAVPIIGGWGSTETAPAATAAYFDSPLAANIGVPLPGTTLKLVPNQDKLEVRVKGPNIMPAYWRNDAATAAAFDEDGFYRIGDAVRLADEERPGAGLLFDGRVSENFKLRTGTWVNVGTLRVAVVDALRPLIQDAVLTGHDGDEVGALLFLNVAACQAFLGEEIDAAALAGHPRLVAQVAGALRSFNAAARGASSRIARFMLQAVPPRAESHEITDKGYVNQRAVLEERAGDVARLYAESRFRV